MEVIRAENQQDKINCKVTYQFNIHSEKQENIVYS